MTELSSQYYDDILVGDASQRRSGRRIKVPPPWMRPLVVDPITLEELPVGEVGLLRHVDLANRGSCIAIQTEDLGRLVGDGIELLGRAAPPSRAVARWRWRNCWRGGRHDRRPPTRAFHLPRNVPEPPLETRQFHKLTALVPKLDAEFIKLVCAKLKENRRKLVGRTTADMVVALDRAVAPEIAETLRLTPRFNSLVRQVELATGWGRIYGNGLYHTLKWIRAKHLTRWIATEVNPPDALGRQARGPAFGFHVLAGASLIHRSPPLCRRCWLQHGLVKSASADPIFPPWLARLISEADPELETAWPCCPGPAGKPNWRTPQSARPAWSSRTAPTTRSRRCETARRLAPGSSVIPTSSASGCRSQAQGGCGGRRFRGGVLLFDMSGCLSPQAFFVVGGLDEFVNSMERYFRHDSARSHCRTQPPPDRLPADAGSIRRSREKAEFAEMARRGVRLLASENLGLDDRLQAGPLRPFQLFNGSSTWSASTTTARSPACWAAAKSLSCVGVSVTPIAATRWWTSSSNWAPSGSASWARCRRRRSRGITTGGSTWRTS